MDILGKLQSSSVGMKKSNDRNEKRNIVKKLISPRLDELAEVSAAVVQALLDQIEPAGALNAFLLALVADSLADDNEGTSVGRAADPDTCSCCSWVCWRTRIETRRLQRLILDSVEILILILNSSPCGLSVLKMANPVSPKFDLLEELWRKRNTQLVLGGAGCPCAEDTCGNLGNDATDYSVIK